MRDVVLSSHLWALQENRMNVYKSIKEWIICLETPRMMASVVIFQANFPTIKPVATVVPESRIPFYICGKEGQVSHTFMFAI